MGYDSTYASLESQTGQTGAAADATGGAAQRLAAGLADLPQDQRSARLAAGLATVILRKRERGGCGIEKNSVYGAAIATPQIARSAGWAKSLTQVAIRSYIFLTVNILVQMLLLYMISTAEMIMDKFSGQMYLCDFGATMDSRGPGGSQYTPATLYGWNQWINRIYVRDSFKALFPHMADEIHIVADPGEYGVESYDCRWLCCFLFMMAVMEDLLDTIRVFSLIWNVPTRSEPWMAYSIPSWAEKERVKAVHDWTELDLVNFKVAGMPLHWKIINFSFIFVPKLWLWKCTAQAGTTFLMETSSIEDLIINSIALTFILGIDEMICENFTAPSTRYMLDKLEDFDLFDLTVEESMTEEEIAEKHDDDSNWWKFGRADFAMLFPMKLCMTCGATWFFINFYYYTHCVRDEDGNWVSHAMSLPLSPSYNLLTWAVPQVFPLRVESAPFWTMLPAGH